MNFKETLKYTASTLTGAGVAIGGVHLGYEASRILWEYLPDPETRMIPTLALTLALPVLAGGTIAIGLPDLISSRLKKYKIGQEKIDLYLEKDSVVK